MDATTLERPTWTGWTVRGLHDAQGVRGSNPLRPTLYGPPGSPSQRPAFASLLGRTLRRSHIELSPEPAGLRGVGIGKYRKAAEGEWTRRPASVRAARTRTGLPTPADWGSCRFGLP